MDIIYYREKFKNIINSLHIEIIESLPNENISDNLLRNLYAFIHERTQSLFCLTQNGFLWDADIILRPIAEATVKFSYLCSFNNVERTQKTDEFWNDLAEINKLKQSKQAKEITNLLNVKNEILEGQILNDEDFENLSNKWTRRNKQIKEQPWSYNEMIKTIAIKSNQNILLGLSRNFTQSSHLIHADETALGIINDRKNNRKEEEKNALLFLHEHRLLGDCISFYIMIALNMKKLGYLKNSEENYKLFVDEFEIDSVLKNKLQKIIQ